MAKEQPVERATGQVERATPDLSEWERARSRQDDLSELDPSEPDAEGEAIPARDADSSGPASGPEQEAGGTGDEEIDESKRASATAKPIAAHNQD
jgi:hypothetical protein